ncbi:unnamed protein product [Phytophthora fragariaefolia]|uniref:Unnamed protein product n=1 Tax=Phytophthora fragariaefolia TaxID=1490495 RepID=A0A9W7CIF7_9STRA|nr:unnamed protein product [Phytophthora fragariaefolia]
MEFLKLRLRHKFDEAEGRYRRMLTLQDDAWWEQCFGLHYILQFNRAISRSYIKLVGSLLADLSTLNYAMLREDYKRLNMIYMSNLKREIYVIQTRANDLLNEISREVDALSPHLDLKAIGALENQVEMVLYKLRKVQNRTLRKENVTSDEVAGNVPLNLFLFSLNSFCSTLINFQQSHNSKIYNDVHRVQSFLLSSLKRFINPAYYKDSELWITALKITVAIMAGVTFSVGVYGFSATVPSCIAYIMGGHLGTSFRTTVNRVGGVVAGSVVPSVFKFFFVQICDPEALGVILSDVVMFIWVGICMYVFFGRGYGSYGGMVAAFVASDTLLRQTDICYPNGSDSSSSIALASYSSLAQTSVAVVIFISVETFLFPKSAITLLRHNILDTLKLHQKAFDLLFGHHLSSSVEMNEAAMADIQTMLVVQIPSRLEAQQQLLAEARVEPLLWRPQFSADKYERVLQLSSRLLSTNYLLFKLLRWFHFRVVQHRVTLNPADIRNEIEENDDNNVDCQAQWKISSSHFQLLARDNFETMEMLFSDTFRYSDPDQTAVFMQMKEAFRLADKDCSGELNADDVTALLGTIFAQSGAVKEEQIKAYVNEFMNVVGKPGRATVSFENFMDAIEHGLKLEVEVFRRVRPRAPALFPDASPEVGIGESPLPTKVTTKETQPVVIQVTEAATSDKMEESRSASIIEPADTAVTVARELDHHTTTFFTSENASVFIRREVDVLNVEDFSITDVVKHMKSAYVEWLLADKRYEYISMEEQLLLNCLISGAESIANSLSGLEEIALSSS